MAGNDSFNNLFLSLYWCYKDAQSTNQNQWVHSCYLKQFYNSLSLADCRRRGGYYPRGVLHSPLCSAWTKLVRSEHDTLLIQATGLDFWSFRYLLVWFAPIYEQYTCLSKDGRIKKVKNETGRPRSLNPEAALGMLLMYTRTTGENSTLSLIFGVPCQGSTFGVSFQFTCC